MAERNPYEVLGVSRQASDGEIKRAFRKLARQYHPDRNQGDAGAEAKFKEVQSAYDTIGTSEARREFDQQEQMRNMFGGGRGRGGPSMNFGGMGGMPRQPPRSAPRQQPKAAAINVGLDITMEQAAAGGEFTFSYKRFKQQGTSMETKRTTLKLRLDAGVKHGTTRTLKGQGHDHPDGQRGDVVVTVRIDAGEAYRWEGDQLVLEVPVPYSVMMLGGKVSVKLLSGKTGKLSVDAMTQVGDRRRMAKAGYNGGDLTIEFVLAEPESLTDAQRQALEDLGSTGL